MSNAFYTPARQAFATGAIDLSTDALKVVLVDTADYTFDAAHDFLADIPAGARIATAALAGVSVVDGVLDATDTVFAGVTGDQFEALVIYQDTGVEATSRLIAYIDTGSGLPLTPNGGSVTATWSNGADKILRV